jgi:hypothetical protein
VRQVLLQLFFLPSSPPTIFPEALK